MYIQPAVKIETIRIAAGSAAGTLILFLAIRLLHQIAPDTVPFDSIVIQSGILGTVIAVSNFFLMGLTVQQAASAKGEAQAYRIVKASYQFRTISQLLWVALCMILPCFHGAAGIIPLFLPGICIKSGGIAEVFFTKKKGRANG